jgi:hypothetical protein
MFHWIDGVYEADVRVGKVTNRPQLLASPSTKTLRYR